MRGDGVGYYAFARAPLIEHSLDFQHDYLAANSSFRDPRVDPTGNPNPLFRTPTGHLENHFSVGPAILWSPFLLTAHAAVLLARLLGSHVAADGFSFPYRIAMAFGTAVYGFLALLISFRLACKYVAPVWALLATLAIWFASSLPLYMYFNPSWSHAHSAFALSLFLWYWHETHHHRTLLQWCLLAAVAGLMINVYYPNALVLTVLAVEAIPQYVAAFRRPPRSGEFTSPSFFSLFARHALFTTVVLLCLLPTFITRYIIYGNAFESGYISLKLWLWRSPAFLPVLFSSEHGLFSWTPILLLAVLGLLIFRWRDPRAGTPLLAAAIAFYIFISCYPDWAGISSFGNRFFVSLTPFFILGLAVFLAAVARFFRSQRTAVFAISAVLACFVLWNVGFMVQWGTHLVPARGPISWTEMAHNQIFAVPREISGQLHKYLFNRANLMQQIEQRDLEQIKRRRAH